MEFSFAVWSYGLAEEWNYGCSVRLRFGRWTRRAAKSIVFVSESVRAHTPAFGLVGISMVIFGTGLQTWT